MHNNFKIDERKKTIRRSENAQINGWPKSKCNVMTIVWQQSISAPEQWRQF